MLNDPVELANRSPAITILVSVFNAVETVKKSIESIRIQTCEDFELLVFDDASTDGTRMLIREAMGLDARIRLIENEKNLGLTANLVRGVNMARGKYIARLDADDSWKSDKLAKQVAFLEQHSDYVLCASSVEFIMDGRNVGKSNPPIEDAEITRRLFTRQGLLDHSTILFRRIINYRMEFTYSQDLDLYARLCFLGKIHCLEESLVLHEIGNRGIGTTKKYLQRQYQNLAYSFFLERHKTGTDSLETAGTSAVRIRDVFLEKKMAALSAVFFKLFLKYRIKKKEPLFWAPLLGIAVAIYPPYLKDYLVRLFIRKKYSVLFRLNRIQPIPRI